MLRSVFGCLSSEAAPSHTAPRPYASQAAQIVDNRCVSVGHGAVQLRALHGAAQATGELCLLVSYMMLARTNFPARQAYVIVACANDLAA